MNRRIATSLAAAALVSACTTMPNDHTYVTEGSFPGHPVWTGWGTVKTERMLPAATITEDTGPVLTAGAFPGHPVWGARFPQVAQPDIGPIEPFPPIVMWTPAVAAKEEKTIAKR